MKTRNNKLRIVPEPQTMTSDDYVECLWGHGRYEELFSFYYDNGVNFDDSKVYELTIEEAKRDNVTLSDVDSFDWSRAIDNLWDTFKYWHGR